jgi:hypothetical protein
VVEVLDTFNAGGDFFCLNRAAIRAMCVEPTVPLACSHALPLPLPAAIVSRKDRSEMGATTMSGEELNMILTYQV